MAHSAQCMGSWLTMCLLSCLRLHGAGWVRVDMDKPPASITTQTVSKSTFQTRERALVEAQANVETQLVFLNIFHPGTVM